MPGLLRHHSSGPLKLMRPQSCTIFAVIAAAISCGCFGQDCSQSGANVEVYALDQSSTQYLSNFFPFNSGPASFVSNLKPFNTFTSDQINFNSSSSSNGEHEAPSSYLVAQYCMPASCSYQVRQLCLAAGDISWPSNGTSSVLLMVDAVLRISSTGMYRYGAGADPASKP